jgi:hypothetical protein
MYYVRSTNDLLHYCGKNDLYSCLQYMKDNKISIPFLRPDSKIDVKDNSRLLSRQLFRHFIDIKSNDLEEFINVSDKPNDRTLSINLGDIYALKLELLNGFAFVNTNKLSSLINTQIHDYRMKSQKCDHDK